MSDVFRIDKDEKGVTIFSKIRMPHTSRRGCMDSARTDLRSAIAAIKASQGEILEGVYSSQSESFFDVENVVFYNLEPATFKNSATYGLRARRCRLHNETYSPGFPHRMDYRLIPTPEIPIFPLVILSFTPGRLNNVFNVWWAAGGGQAIKTGEVKGRYGMHVELAGPSVPENPAGKIKALFDGIIASLQQDSSPDPVAVKRLSEKHQIPEALIEKRLRAPMVSAIRATSAKGPVRLVRQSRRGVIWNPADDLCEECTLIVTQKPTPICNVYVYALMSTLCTD
jgi:hypothetical protein